MEVRQALSSCSIHLILRFLHRLCSAFNFPTFFPPLSLFTFFSRSLSLSLIFIHGNCLPHVWLSLPALLYFLFCFLFVRFFPLFFNSFSLLSCVYSPFLLCIVFLRVSFSNQTNRVHLLNRRWDVAYFLRCFAPKNPSELALSASLNVQHRVLTHLSRKRSPLYSSGNVIIYN